MGDTGAMDAPDPYQSSIDMASLVFARRDRSQHTLELIKNMAKYIPDNMDKDVWILGKVYTNRVQMLPLPGF
jgi:hypothetical protein